MSAHGCDLRIPLNTVTQAATVNHLESESEMKPIDYYCSDPKLSFYKCKNWGSEGKSDLSKVTEQDCGKARTPVNPQIYLTLQRQEGDTTNMKHCKNIEKNSNFTITRKSQLRHPEEHSKEVLITSPRKRHEGSEVRGNSRPRAESKVGGKIVSDNGGVFKLCFSNETNHWLFIF